MARRPNAHSSAGRAAGAKEMLIERLSPRGLRKPAASRAWLQTSHSSGKAGAMSPTRDLWLGQRRATRCVPSPYQAVPGGGPAPGMLPARRTRYPCLPRPAQANLAPGRTPRARAALCLVRGGPMRPCASSASPRCAERPLGPAAGRPCAAGPARGLALCSRGSARQDGGVTGGAPRGPQPAIHTARTPPGRHCAGRPSRPAVHSFPVCVPPPGAADGPLAVTAP